MPSNVEIVTGEDNTKQFLSAYDAAVKRGLTKIGMQAERFAKQLCPVDTGRLRNSITHATDGKSVIIGTNVEYGKYVELGTGRQAETGGNPMIKGHKPHPYLRPAATNHVSEYRTLMETELKK